MLIHTCEEFLVLAKPSGMQTHPEGPGRREKTALWWARHFAGRHVYPVHRLDRATSGLLVFAANPEVAKVLAASLAAGAWQKRYVAIVRGHLKAPGETGIFNAPVKAYDDLSARAAVTHFTVLAHAQTPWPSGAFPSSRYSLVALAPPTGRTHQLRLHLRGASHPIVGDTRYGDGHHNQAFRHHLSINRLCLHAGGVRFPDPFSHASTGALRSFTVAPPADLAAALALFPEANYSAVFSVLDAAAAQSPQPMKPSAFTAPCTTSIVGMTGGLP